MRTLASVDIQFVKGIGEKRAKVLREHGIPSLEELLYLFPRRYLDRTTVKPIQELRSGDEATIVGKIVSAEVQKGKRERFVALVGDGTGFLQCVWFQQVRFWRRYFQVGEQVSFAGKVGYFNGFQMTHPEFDKIDETGDLQNLNTGKIVPLYPSSESLGRIGLHSKGMRTLLRRSLDGYAELIQDPLPETTRQEYRLIGLAEALEKVHFPDSPESLEAARQRLKFEEFFYLELILALRRQKHRSAARGIRFRHVGNRTRELIEGLTFSLTGAQRKVLREIWADMQSPMPMNRLVQGDVGSGKTIVAVVAMLMAVENGYQAALMAPTEILAEQHYLNLHALLEGLGVRVLLLTGQQKQKERKENLARIESGDAAVVIGTHALIQPDVRFQRLGLAIVDEQHRFGVLQRASLRAKGEQPDVLVMTATPIPRTLSMTYYGDLDVSIIDELPEGRKPVRTVWRPSRKRRDVYHFVRDALVQGEQGYIVFPLVEESPKLELRAAQETYETVKAGFFDQFRLALLHGRMAAAEKETVMARFKNGQVDLLIATTVIEVGVDVPNATVMVIEHADRFGLTQLHQLRGRVGRGRKDSVCVLIVDTPLSVDARRRVTTLCETNDGFRIAEADLEIRGPGEFLGTRQHGLPELRIANLVADRDILTSARRAAFEVADKSDRLAALLKAVEGFNTFRRFKENMEMAAVG